MFATVLVFTSCKKDEDGKTPPTLTINDGVKLKDLDVNLSSVDIKIVVSAATDRKLKTISVEKAIPGQATATVFTNSPDKKDYTTTYTDALSGQTVGQIITYTIKAVDDNDNNISETYTVTIISSENVYISNSIQLGAQSNSTIDYKFLGIANNFNSYTAGTSGTARTNSSKIDFVYYYGTNDKNTFAAPTNTDGAQVIWGTEITAWTTKNDTKFKQTSLVATDFDNIMDVTKKDDTFKNIDFSFGALSKYTNLQNNDVIAYLTASGKKGLIKFTSTASNNSGAVTLYVISQK